MVEIRVELDPRINFAMQQNDVPVVQTVHIDNTGDTPLHDLEFTITAEPAFAEPWRARIEAIPEGQTYNLRVEDFRLSPRYLGELTERVHGHLRFELRSQEETLAEVGHAVSLLAKDEWNGLRSLPEILAAFVLPNHPVVARVLRRAADILGDWSGDPSLSGYQTGKSARTYEMAGAIYTALQQEKLTYINPPASFEQQGQRVRLPDRVLDQRMATCFDLALFAAACMEQAGLHPLVVLVEGHAFVGVWLHDECFPEPALEEPLLFRKRVDLKEIAVFDPTCVTSRPSPSFDGAVRKGLQELTDPARFQCAVDIRRARKGGITPLPERVHDEEAEAAAEAVEDDTSGPAPRPDLSQVEGADTVARRDSDEEKPKDAESRIDRWCRKLLDLSLRNRLLNFRETKKTVPLLCPDLPTLEDALAGGTVFKVRPRPKDMGDADPRDAEAHRRRTGDDALTQLLEDELRQKRLHADLEPAELDRRLLEVYRAARLGLEEGGSSTLFLAVGMLSWFESPTSEVQRLAPILLIPLDLRRRSVVEGFSLGMGDDEPRLNVTLVEMLKRDHGVTIDGLDPLPEDDSGLDVPRILGTFRRKIRDIPRWDVLDTSYIGLFSFAKFLMWRDLMERTEELLQNPLVDHLVNRPEETYPSDGPFPDPDRIDQERKVAATYCPVPADSSQLAAADGRTFVLQGPPGTGKSQTITNLIAHCLTEGKRVLFVSEKMPALEVVQRRLHQAGLAQFCLELHSNKSNKREVISQLGQALAATAQDAEGRWQAKARELETLRDQLNRYVEALHRRRGNGLSLFQVTSRLIGLRDVVRLPVSFGDPEALDAERLESVREVVRRVAVLAGDLGSLRENAWRAVRRGDWTPLWEGEVFEKIASLTGALPKVHDAAAEVADATGLPTSGWSRSDLQAIDDLAGLLVDAPSPPTVLMQSDWGTVEERSRAWCEHGRRRDELRGRLYPRFRPQLLDLDLDRLQQAHASSEATFWPLSWLRRRSVRKALREVTGDGRAPKSAELSNLLQDAIALRDEEQRLRDADADARGLFGAYWKEGAADWDQIASLVAWAGKLRGVAARLAGTDLERATTLRASWARLANEGRGLLRSDGSLGTALNRYRDAHERLQAVMDEIRDTLDADDEELWGPREAPDVIGTARALTETWTARRPELNRWCAWRRARSEALECRLDSLIAACESGEVAPDELLPVFERSYLNWWFDEVVSREPLLAQFVSLEHERTIARFREVDEEFQELTRQLIVARLASRVPATQSQPLPESEVGILQRELNKKRRHRPIRQLFQQIPHLMPRLKPCLLMSPMSVAQCLDASHPAFDLVVFDEASQIPVWDSIGALARGKQAVIVGDPKQLPPTSFFQKAESDEDGDAVEYEMVEDLESILDDAIGSGVPCRDLRWHYRSRHESLIAFSNYHYYENRLLTFPSPIREDIGVSWRHVADGVYDRGKSATNRREAEELVAEISRRLHDPVLAEQSIGVVTFSQAQQTLVEDLLEQARRTDTVVDRGCAEDKLERVFVKNLENVQGDERDVILFSICYGPDHTGRPYVNFGPMNKEGGERRLNVAVTRARRELIVFSTLCADQIDLAKTKAPGVRDLKTFLAYAERGMAAIAEAAVPGAAGEFDSPFERDVHDALVERGWNVHSQVGCGGYRIDLGVVDPEASGRYLLGVECDGANYHRARSARDRDKLREGVLGDLGWQLHRIWSSDWWKNPGREIEKLERALDAARNARAKPARPRFAADAEPEESADSSEDSTDIAPDAKPEVSSANATAPRSEHSSTVAPPVYESFQVEYALGTSEEFYLHPAEAHIQSLIPRIVEVEGPVSLALVARRVAAHWGLERVSRRALKRVRRLTPRDEVILQESEHGEFLWPNGADPNSYKTYRIRGDSPETARSAEDHPVEELAAATLEVLRNHISVPESDLIRGVSRQIGFARTGSRVESRMRAGIDLLVERGMAQRKEDQVVLATER